MKTFLILLFCLVAVLGAGFHSQIRDAAQQTFHWGQSLVAEDPCTKSDRQSQQQCAEQQNKLAGKIDSRLDLSDQQRALNKALGN